MTRYDFENLLRSAQGRKIVCIGDVMLDRFVYGSVHRVSPEAPVPVLAKHREASMPGAVGNVAVNAASLGAQVVLVSACGDDPAGDELLRLLSSNMAVRPEVIRTSNRQTTEKVRFVAGGQQVMRLDVEHIRTPDPDESTQLLNSITKELNGAACLMISDYAKGLVTADLMTAAVQLAARAGIPVVVDPKGRDFLKYGKSSVIKPNATELQELTGLPTSNNQEVETALTAAFRLCEADAVLVTRAGQGLSLMKRNESAVHMKGETVEVFDVSGAGDTSLAGLAVGLAAGGDLEQAAGLALAASRIAVTKRGTATVSAEEVLAQTQKKFQRHSEKLTVASTLEACVSAVSRWRGSGHRVGFTNGCFDILHPGHLRVLEAAKAACDRLIVGLNSDASVRGLKGPERPINSEKVRARMLLALSAVDEVVVFEEPNPLHLIQAISPDILVKGGDYTEETIVGADIVRERGGDVLIVPLLEGQSTTATIAKMKSSSF